MKGIWIITLLRESSGIEVNIKLRIIEHVKVIFCIVIDKYLSIVVCHKL